MQEEFFPAAEKILSDIHQLFTQDPKLKSFEIIPSLENENKSPVHYEEHCLGLESWCVPYLYSYAYKNLMKIRQSKRKFNDSEKCNSLLLGALLLNPDVTTLWNMRKELINSAKLDLYFELHFSSVVLTFKPKCADIYSFRKWILQKIMNGSSANIGLLESEVEVCEAAGDRYSNNYHAWTHRIWCLSQSFPALFQREWGASLRWIQTHVSDYSGFHYRQKLIKFLLTYIQNSSFNDDYIKVIMFNVDEATKSFLQNIKNLELRLQTIPLPLKIFIYELTLNSELIWHFIGHETLWCHRRFIFYEIKKILFEANQLDKCWGCQSIGGAISIERTEHYTPEQLSFSFSLYEGLFINKCSQQQKSETRQISYANKHKEWLTRFSNFQFPNNHLYNFAVEMSSLF